MAFKKATANVLKELIIPELSKIKDDINNVYAKLEFTNKRLDDINLHLVDQSRRIDGLREELSQRIDALREELAHRIDETNDRIDVTNDRINRLYEVIVHRDEHSSLEQKVLDLERDVREIKIKIAV
jgi:predicted  nucleic acid-binding Zn-ribbon protein